jgi:hypothetical protein
MADRNVTVLDSEQRFLEYTHPAVARKLLKEGGAVVWSRDPFAIKLTKAVPKPSYQRRADMEINSYTQFFRDECEVYVQNVSNAQVSVTFEIGPGRTDSYLFPNRRDPINLSQQFPFAVIKNSMDFRKMLTRRPAVLKLLDEKEFESFYAKKAEQDGLYTVNEKGKRVPDLRAALDKAEEERNQYQRKEPLPNAKVPEPLHDVVDDDPHFGGKKTVQARQQLQVDDVINPRVLHLCNQVNTMLSDQEKMPANQLLGELKDLTGDLKVDDFEYIRAHGWYQSVKKWAKTELARAVSEHGEKED